MLSFFPRDVLDEILDLTESVPGGFPTYSYCSILHSVVHQLLFMKRGNVTYTKTAFKSGVCSYRNEFALAGVDPY